jgi:hypothetical protein
MPLLTPNRTTVAVLGSGPSGLVAAYAADLLGWAVTIITDSPRPSGMFGAQYLHEPIPHLILAPPVRVKYQLRGTAEGYRRRVYGERSTVTVSPEELAEEHDAWDLRSMYQALWIAYEDNMLVRKVLPGDVETIKRSYDAVISTIPADALCLRPDLGHFFSATEIWAAGEAPEIGISLPYDCEDNTVICNGEDTPAWYRMARIYGRLSIEWPGDLFMRPPLPTVARVRKPLVTSCDCHLDEKFIRAGRYGLWRKGVLVHQAFNQAYDYLSERV